MRSTFALKCVSREMPSAVVRIRIKSRAMIVLEAIGRFLCLRLASEGQFSAFTTDRWRLHEGLWK